FSADFLAFVKARRKNREGTIGFYASCVNRLLASRALEGIRLDKINGGTVERYVQERTSADGSRKKVGVATVNRELATLRRMLRLAEEWGAIRRAPRIRLLEDEKSRELILTLDEQERYLKAAEGHPALHDVALLMFETGVRPSEALRLSRPDVVLNPEE